MKSSEIASRLTGILTPLGEASWQPAEGEISAARRIIRFLEDQRELYEAGRMEAPFHCVSSVIDIRHFLSAELGKLQSGSRLAASLRGMRAACRKFLDRVGTEGRGVILHANDGHAASWTFYNALGELRGTCGVHLAKMATLFELDVEDRLASILPANADAGDDDRPFRSPRVWYSIPPGE